MSGESDTGNKPDQWVLRPQDLQQVFEVLQAEGFQLLGPTIREGAIVYDRLDTIDDLPVGWTDEQEGGKYRLKKRDDAALFSYAVGPQSWKKFLFPPNLRLWRATRDSQGFAITPDEPPAPRYAFIGARSCELHAIAIQDQVFMSGSYSDQHYQAAREEVFIVAVNCAVAGGTCFCASMNTGPKSTSGYDLALTEILDSDDHYFLVEVGTDRGAEVISRVPHHPAGTEQTSAAQGVVQQTARQMGRRLDTSGIKELLYSNYEHSRWDQVAQRCLTCANCTMVCPTCFCHTLEDTTDVTGQQAERRRRWDSCFTLDFSYIHGGQVRSTARSRYRQWLTHKLATWIDQFGTSGCVGCGRCITWCPVGIDITEEVDAIRRSQSRKPGGADEGEDQG